MIKFFEHERIYVYRAVNRSLQLSDRINSNPRADRREHGHISDARTVTYAADRLHFLFNIRVFGFLDDWALFEIVAQYPCENVKKK